MSNALNWFEIPVQDVARATRFYEVLLGEKLKQETFSGTAMALFPKEAVNDLSGALVHDPKRKPSGDGSLVYLNAAGKLEACLERVGRAGGTLVMPKTDIGEHGFIALVRDSEGNTLGLHSPKKM